MVECFVTGAALWTLVCPFEPTAVLAFLSALLRVIQARTDDRPGPRQELVRSPSWWLQSQQMETGKLVRWREGRTVFQVAKLRCVEIK